MAVSEPVLNTPGTGEVAVSGNGTRTEIVVGGLESHGDYAVMRYDVVAGDEPLLHTHSKEDEMVFVVEGEITAFVGDTRVDVGPGAFAALPRGVPHTVRVKGAYARLLLTVVPAGVERFFVPKSDADADPARFGVTLHGPPPA